MIGVFRGKAVTAMRQRTAELEAQVEAISVRLNSATDQLTVVSGRLAEAIDRLEAQAARATDTEQRAEALAGLVANQTAAIMRLDECDERRSELDRRVRADMIRLERQAMIDVTELRQTSLVLAERLLSHGRDFAAPAAATEKLG